MIAFNRRFFAFYFKTLFALFSSSFLLFPFLFATFLFPLIKHFEFESCLRRLHFHLLKSFPRAFRLPRNWIQTLSWALLKFCLKKVLFPHVTLAIWWIPRNQRIDSWFWTDWQNKNLEVLDRDHHNRTRRSILCIYKRWSILPYCCNQRGRCDLDLLDYWNLRCISRHF